MPGGGLGEGGKRKRLVGVMENEIVYRAELTTFLS